MGEIFHRQNEFIRQATAKNWRTFGIQQCMCGNTQRQRPNWVWCVPKAFTALSSFLPSLLGGRSPRCLQWHHVAKNLSRASLVREEKAARPRARPKRRRHGKEKEFYGPLHACGLCIHILTRAPSLCLGANDQQVRKKFLPIQFNLQRAKGVFYYFNCRRHLNFYWTL